MMNLKHICLRILLTVQDYRGQQAWVFIKMFFLLSTKCDRFELLVDSFSIGIRL